MDQMMKVGELARRTGLTVRTLHHYDEVGLLLPGSRTASGHRLYGEAELRRLQQIASLKHLGVPLSEIRACLERPEYSLGHVLALQVERIDQQIGRQSRLREQIQGLLGRLESGEAVSVDDLARTIEGSVRFERYYSPEQLDQLAERRDRIGEARIRDAQGEWSELFGAYERAMRDGIDPAAPEVQALARRSDALIGEFTGGDPAIKASLGTMYSAEGGENVLAGFGMKTPPGLFEYMAAVRAAGVDRPGPETNEEVAG